MGYADYTVSIGQLLREGELQRKEKTEDTVTYETKDKNK